MRLIDADSLKMEDFRHCMDCDSIIQVIKRLPVIESEPVVHACWEWGGLEKITPYCTNCGSYPTDGIETKYCPNCGAKMNLEENK